MICWEFDFSAFLRGIGLRSFVPPWFMTSSFRDFIFLCSRTSVELSLVGIYCQVFFLTNHYRGLFPLSLACRAEHEGNVSVRKKNSNSDKFDLSRSTVLGD